MEHIEAQYAQSGAATDERTPERSATAPIAMSSPVGPAMHASAAPGGDQLRREVDDLRAQLKQMREELDDVISEQQRVVEELRGLKDSLGGVRPQWIFLRTLGCGERAFPEQVGRCCRYAAQRPPRLLSRRWPAWH